MSMRRAGRRWFAPEVVQTSAMDCGPAALKCLLEGFGIPVSYGRLREACQTDVDGTSIDTLEEVAVQLGLNAEQVMVPVDHLLLPEADALPAIVVVRLASRFTHFVVVWRQHSRVVQVMDPATGRRWPTCTRFLDELYVHTLPIPAATWRAWAGTEELCGTLRRRWTHLGLARPALERVMAAALDDLDWRPLATLDATTRMVSAILRAGGLRRGRQATRLFVAFYERARREAPDTTRTIPEAYWTVRPAPPGSDGVEQVLLRGAVLVRVRGQGPPVRVRRETDVPEGPGGPAPLSPELVAALEAPRTPPGRALLRLLRADGVLDPATLMVALATAATGLVVEALLLRGLFDLGRELGLVQQRLGALGALLIFVAALLLLELPIAAALLRLGRRLEAHLRLAFLEKIPRLSDRYIQSRPTSDMAERSHSVHQLRLLPDLGGQLLRLLCELALTTAGIVWLAPASAPVALLALGLTLGLPLAAQPLLTERDLRIRTHVGALCRFYLDALLGLVAVRTHGAERAMRREHESLLVEWARAGLEVQRTVVAVEGVQALLGFGLVAWLLFDYLVQGGEAGGVLLLVYWALNLPVLGQEVALLVRQYPVHRNVTLRLLEPLGALEESSLPESPQSTPPPGSVPMAVPARGVAIVLEGVSVRVAGHTVLADLDLAINPGSHIAIVGPSGAGKSSLVGLLLGWYRAATGQLLVDGVPLDSGCLAQLRQETAWVDPAVQLWNCSLLDNLRYGARGEASPPLASVIAQADLRSVLERLPDGLQTPLGEGGGLVSGGEGQRVRFGRALLRPGVRLVLLDEPFRGLDRERRRELLARARRLWRDATLLCITHDVGATQTFDRVLVVEGGRIVESGAPADLAAQPDTHYRAMLESEAAVREGLWASGIWRRLGELIEAVARHGGLPLSGRETPRPPEGLAQASVERLGSWIEASAAWLGLEAEAVEVSYAEVERLLRGAGTAILRLPGKGEPRFLALPCQRRRTVTVLGPDLVVHRLGLETVRAALCQELAAPLLTAADELLAAVGVPVRRRGRVRQALLGEQLSAERVGGCWLVTLPASTSFWSQMCQARVPRRLLVLVGAHTTQYLLWLLSWWLVGQGALQGRLDRGWLLAWALLLLTLVPLRLLVTWSQGRLAIGVGGLLKRRLLAGALRLDPEEVRQQGAGQLLGRVIESEAVESLALSGGVLGLMAGLELALAAAVLSVGAGGGLQALVLLGWMAGTGLLGWRYVRQRRRWTTARLGLTHDLVERLAGHRTRLAQEVPAHWHDGEDEALARYLALARAMDRTAASLLALVPRGWLLVGLLSFAPAFVTGRGAPPALAVSLGGLLLAYMAFKKLATGLWHLAGAALAWEQVAPLFYAAARPEVATPPALAQAPGVGVGTAGELPPVLEAHDLVFRYRPRGEPVLRGCSLRIGAGDQLLLEGPSGGGKSTLATLLTGLRLPESGLLLLGGLDRQTLGAAGWQRRVVAAPQFHDNHVFGGTFAFNLLMGRRWPPHAEDLTQAEALCHALGLTDLLHHMPAGLLQLVGETGWQLSHGERSRLFLARALLQGAACLILDESFAALDPATLQQALRCVLERAPTLVVIAHP